MANARGFRNQMKRLFNAHIQLAYENEQVAASVNSPVASRTGFWWNERRPGEQGLWDSKIELDEKFFHEIIPVPRAVEHEHTEGSKTLFAGHRSISVDDVSDLHIEATASALLGASLWPVQL